MLLSFGASFIKITKKQLKGSTASDVSGLTCRMGAAETDLAPEAAAELASMAIRFLSHQIFCNCVAVTGVLLDHFSTHKGLLLTASGRATSFQTTADSWN